MPTRKGRRIRPKKAGPELDGLMEWHMLWGEDDGGFCRYTPAEAEAVWNAHGKAYTAFYIRFMPGSRPWGWYLHEGVERPHEFCGTMELEHLMALGHVDAAEERAAHRRMRKHGCSRDPLPHYVNRTTGRGLALEAFPTR